MCYNWDISHTVDSKRGNKKSFAKHDHLRKTKFTEFTYILAYFKVIVNAKVVKVYEKCTKQLDKSNKFL